MKSMRYTDINGRQQTLTFVQWVYLHTADMQGSFSQGWGGHSSTQTARLLRERGLISFNDYGGKWRVTGATKLGRDVLEAWDRRTVANREQPS